MKYEIFYLIKFILLLRNYMNFTIHDKKNWKIIYINICLASKLKVPITHITLYKHLQWSITIERLTQIAFLCREGKF